MSEIVPTSSESPFDGLMGEDGRWSARDLMAQMNYTTSTHKFLQGLEGSQLVSGGQSKGAYSASPLYVGTEVVQTAGGPQRMKVVYKRGPLRL